MDIKKQQLYYLKRKHEILKKQLNEKQQQLNELAYLAIKKKQNLSLNKDVTYYKNYVHELTLQLKELEQQIDNLKEQDKSGMSQAIKIAALTCR